MYVCKVELDQATYDQLVGIAMRELRPIPWQVHKMLREAIEQNSAREVPVPATCEEPRDGVGVE